jgi:hypothetical protein
MVQEISEFYKEKGYKKVYININKEPRRVAILYKTRNEKHTMSYAKYLYTSYYKIDISKEDHIDHINGDKMDDRIENLQVISGQYNRIKDHKHKEMILLKCPVCGSKFLFDKRNLSSHPDPCCSRRCGGIKSHWTIKTRS